MTKLHSILIDNPIQAKKLTELLIKPSETHTKLDVTISEKWWQSNSHRSSEILEVLKEAEKLLPPLSRTGAELLQRRLERLWEENLFYILYTFGRLLGANYHPNGRIQKLKKYLAEPLFHFLLQSTLDYTTAAFMAGYYSTAPFDNDVNHRISKHMLKYPFLTHSLISSGAPISFHHLNHAYQHTKTLVWYGEYAEKLFIDAIETRINRGFEPIEMPIELSRLVLTETMTNTIDRKRPSKKIM